ncbi:hypothetical protein ACQPXM_18030 [Kribbella sp. CA-253562]|uniref:hypothetical protein n=1 Tax=Kribbella sp. CA-253562 TaxID=3239942 RepID=UPI003D8E1C89
MTRSLRVVLLAVLGVSGLGVGGWAYFASEHWYRTFPGFGHHWLPVLGPYSQHLVKDVGAMYLGLAALTVFAIWKAADTTVVRLTATAWTIFNALHFAYHLQHLHMYSGSDVPLNVIALSTVLVIGAVLVLPLKGERVRT